MLMSTGTVLKRIKNEFKSIYGFLQSGKCSTLSLKESSEISALEETSEDVSIVSPYFSKSFNIAAYVNSSETLQNLVKLNVDLSKIEKKPHIVEKLLKLDFERHMKNHIMFLNNYVEMEDIGYLITKNPMIFYEHLDDLHVRVNYLKSKRFTNDEIRRIVVKNPFWLMFSTIRIDRRFGYFQKCLDLHGTEVRQVTTKQPNLITYNLHHVKTNLFVVKEEIGFDDKEIKTLVLDKPKILMLNQQSLLERFNYIHNIMRISHTAILAYPSILFFRNFKVKQRHLFLDKLGRAQYDPTKENYVPLSALVEDTDAEFCRKYAKCSVSNLNMFLKTL